MPFYAQDDSDGNALVDEELHWDAQPAIYAISLDVLMGSQSVETTRLEGEVKGRIVHMLVDSGSTHTFMDTKILQKVGLMHKDRPQAASEVASGQHIVSRLCC